MKLKAIDRKKFRVTNKLKKVSSPDRFRLSISRSSKNIFAQIIDDVKFPTEVTKKGWIFDPQEGQKIQGKYIFGEDIMITENDLKFSLNGNNIQSRETQIDESVVVILITIVSIGVAIFYLKGYKK